MAERIDLSGYCLTFDDEFNGFNQRHAGTGVWNTTFYWGGRSLPSNGELQYYSDASVGVDPFSVSNGALHITASPSQGGSDGLPYTSGMITTDGAFSQTYGYFEMRAKLPAGKGLWPAFWMLPNVRGWPPEIDVMESHGNRPTQTHYAAHHRTANGPANLGSWVDLPVNVTMGYHSYGVEWTPSRLRYYFDQEKIGEIATPPGLDQPMYLLANLAVGGNWPGVPDASTRFPARLSIDYIRAYSRDPAAVGVPMQVVSSPDSVPSEHPPTQGPQANGVSHDFDGDGCADVLWFNSQTRHVALWTMNGTSRTAAALVASPVGPGWEIAGRGDFNGDARADILFRNTASGDLAVWFMNGLTRTAGIVLDQEALPSSTRVAGVADMNGDGMADLVLRDANGDVSVWLMNGASRLSAGVVQRSVNRVWSVAGMGDFNGDGAGDILWQRSDTGSVAVWTMNGATRLDGRVAQESVNAAWSIQSVGDVNGDGKDDIVWRNTDGHVATWQMNGATRQSAGLVGDGPLPGEWQIADAADFNADATSDLLLRNRQTGGSAVWIMSNGTRVGGELIQQSGDTSWQVASGFDAASGRTEAAPVRWS